MVRTGIGYDVHRLADGETLVLGGVIIPAKKGAVGHSDGDVLTHAIVDALLGAASLGDIGTHFPSSDEKWKGASSLKFLDHAVELLKTAGYSVANVDGTIILESPKLSDQIHTMRETLADRLNVDLDCVSVKATTTDSLGFIGVGEGIGAVALATLMGRPNS